MLIGSASGAAFGEFAVNDNGRNTSDATLLRFGNLWFAKILVGFEINNIAAALLPAPRQDSKRG
jgi:hypothetical protein